MTKQLIKQLIKTKPIFTVLSCDPSYTNYGVVLIEYNSLNKKENILFHKTIHFGNKEKDEYFCGKKINLKTDKTASANYNNYRLATFYSVLEELAKKADVLLVEGQSFKNINEPKSLIQLIAGLSQYKPTINKIYKEYQPTSWRKHAFGIGNLSKTDSIALIKQSFKDLVNLSGFDEHQYDALGLYLGFKKDMELE